MNWYKIIKLSQNILNIKPPSNLRENIHLVYETEYKLHMINSKPNNIHPKRFENIKNFLMDNFKNSSKQVQHNLLILFEKWLAAHAILDPEQWGKTRLKEAIDMNGDSLSNFKYNYGGSYLGIILDEFDHYSNINKNYSKSYTSGINNIKSFYSFINAINNIAHLIPYLNKFIESLKQSLKNDYLISEPEENFDYIDDYGLSDIVEHLAVDNTDQLEELFKKYLEESEIFNIYSSISTILVFPLWYAYWEEKGIDDVRENVENTYNELKTLNVNNYKKTVQVINRAIQTVHMGGDMLDYSQQYIGEEISLEDLTGLTEGYLTKQWDDDLRNIGVKV
jgi:hypothetical protein